MGLGALIQKGVAKYRIAREEALKRDIQLGELKARRARIQAQVAQDQNKIRRYGLGIERERLGLERERAKLHPRQTGQSGFVGFGPMGFDIGQQTSKQGIKAQSREHHRRMRKHRTQSGRQIVIQYR